MISLLAHQKSRPNAKKLLSTIKSTKVKAKLPTLFSLIGEIKQHITISTGNVLEQMILIVVSILTHIRI